ncbi:MAG TPA: hypothetical protein VK784_17205 [Pseudonocardiaceae bacterium]|nr:hypothetical protein [Pseudonocardiaceae bacterium]
MVGLGLVTTACTSNSTTSTPSTSTTATAKPAAETVTPFLSQLHAGSKIASTVPAKGDVNPYGLAVVPASAGRLTAGNILVSNFNDKANVQGTGTTIVQVSPAGQTTLFADVGKLPAGMACPGGVGLTTALGILPGGWVVVGSLPTTKSGALPGLDPAGCLIVLNDRGTAVRTITNKNIVGPWDLAVTSTATSAQVFVSNALGGNTSTSHGTPVTGNCTVVRLDFNLSAASPPALTSTTVVGSGYPWRANKAALVLAPTGLALGHNGTLYVADTQTNTISAIPQATTRTTAQVATAGLLSAGGALDAPLGMTLAPDGDLVVVNGNNGNAVEITPAGRQLTTKTLVRNGAGDLFGIITTPDGIVAVNDGTNALEVFRS